MVTLQLLAAAATVALAQSAEYYWPCKNGNIRRTGSSQITVPVNLSTGPSWQWNEEVQVYRSTPLLDDRRNIYMTVSSGKVIKFSPEGIVLWEYLGEASIPVVPHLYNGTLYALQNTGHAVLLALDMETGKEKWHVDVADHVHQDTATVLAHSGLIIVAVGMSKSIGYLGEMNNLVIALSAEDGSLRWKYAVHAPLFNFMASVAEDNVVFADNSGDVYCLRLADGSLVWKSSENTRTFSTGAAVLGENEVIYSASNAAWSSQVYGRTETTINGVLRAYRLKDGALLWTRITGLLEGNQAPAVGNLQGNGKGRLSVVAAMGRNPGHPYVMTAVSVLTNWTPEWIMTHIFKAAKMVPDSFWIWLSPPPDRPGAIIALDAETGETQWTFLPPSPPRHAAAGDSERLLDRLAARIEDSRTELLCSPDSWAAPTIGGDGTVYAGFLDGNLFAIRDSNGDGHISEEEVSAFAATDAWLGSVAVAPGLLVGTPCGGGIYAFTSPQSV